MKKPVDLKSVIIGILGTVLVFTLLGANRKKEARFNTITAKNIEIINPKGIPVAVLRGTEEGGGVVIRNKEGKTVAVMGAKGRGALDIYNNQLNKRVVSIQANKAHDGAIYLYDRYGEPGWAMSGKR